MLSFLEKELGRLAVKKLLPMWPGDVAATYGHVTVKQDIGLRPATPIEDGIVRFLK